MKRIIIVLGVLFLAIYAFGKYQNYQRYHSQFIEYSTTKKINTFHYNPQLVINYNNAIEELNAYVKLQWFAHKIDVLKPEKEDLKTKSAVKIYHEKLAVIKYYEDQLTRSYELKQQGLSKEEIQYVFEGKKSVKEIAKEAHRQLLRKLFKASNSLKFDKKSKLVFEIQKRLVAKGYPIAIDGLDKSETQEAIIDFQKKHNFFPDGEVDWLTFEALIN